MQFACSRCCAHCRQVAIRWNVLWQDGIVSSSGLASNAHEKHDEKDSLHNREINAGNNMHCILCFLYALNLNTYGKFYI